MDELTDETKWTRVLAFMALGACLFSLGAAPYHWPGVVFVAVALFQFGLLSAERPRDAFVSGFFFGMVTQVTALFWVVDVVMRYGGLAWPIAGVVACLLWAAQALVFGFVGYGANVLARRGVAPLVSLPLLFTLGGALAPWLFPVRLSAAQTSFTAYIQMADLGGQPLVDFMTALAGTSFATAITGPRRVLGAALLIGAVGAPLVYGAIRLPAVEHERARAETFRVGVIQPNIRVEDRYNPAHWYDQLELLREKTATLEKAGGELVVWPETSYPFAMPRSRTHDAPGFLAVREDGARGPVLFGALTTYSAQVQYNSIVMLARDGRITGYADKVHLVPFGEFIPLWDYLPWLHRAFSSRGVSAGKVFHALAVPDHGHKIGPLNCYEDVDDSFARIAANEGASLLINVTNDAWFGDTREPHLHESLAIYRAIETRRDLVRAVNTGVSSHIAATGHELHTTPTSQPVTFIADARLLRSITWWTRFGDWVTPLCVLLALLLAFFRRSQPHSREAR